jgi:hypothetical protein
MKSVLSGEARIERLLAMEGESAISQKQIRTTTFSVKISVIYPLVSSLTNKIFNKTKTTMHVSE